MPGAEQHYLIHKKLALLDRQLKRGLVLASVWNFGVRNNYAGNPFFHGNSPTQVVEQCILRFTRQNDLVVDPMAGSGTTIDVCKKLGRKYKVFDLTPVRKDIKQNDSIRRIPLKNNIVDFVFLHPPYWNLVAYSNKDNDLSRMHFNEYLDGMEMMIKECYRILKPGKFICLLSGDRVRNGSFVPITRKLSNIVEDCNFIDYGNAIKITCGSQSDIVKGKGRLLFAEVAYSKHLKINHDVVSFWRKPL